MYFRKDYFSAVDLTEICGHLLDVYYMPKTVDVYEKGLSVFHMEYVMENRTKVRVIEFYLTDFGLRGKGYGTACMNEIVTELGKKGITLIYAPTGYDLAPLGYTGPAQYKELMAGFYEKKGYSEISHSRMRRYEILMEFAGEQKEIPSEALSDVMLLDLYLRENLKSRPSFASDQKPYERLIWDYRKAKKIPKTAHIEVFRDGKKLLFDYTDRDPLTNNAQLTDITDEVNDNYGNV